MYLFGFSKTIKKFHVEIEERVDSALNFPEFWLPAIRKQWMNYKPLSDKFGSIVDPQNECPFEKLHFGVYTATEGLPLQRRMVEAKRMQKLLESNKERKFSLYERDAIREIIRPFVAHSINCSLLSSVHDAPFIDWQDTDPIHRMLSLSEWNQNTKKFAAHNSNMTVLESLFSIALPELRPNNVKQFVKFVKNKSAVASLREQIMELMGNGSTISDKLGDKIRNEANLAQLSARKNARIISFIGSFVGLSATASLVEPLIEEIGDAVAQIGIGVSEEIGSTKVSKVSTKKYAWYYALLNIVGAN